MYADVGRPSIPWERLLKSSLLTGLFSVCLAFSRWNLRGIPGLREPANHTGQAGWPPLREYRGIITKGRPAP